jgi:hypothetical protein
MVYYDDHAAAMRAYGEQCRRLATAEQPGFRMTSDEGGWTKEDALRYIENWCPDYVKDYICSLEQPGSAVQGEAVAYRWWDGRGWLYNERPPPGAEERGLQGLGVIAPPAPAAEHGDALAEQYRTGWEAGHATAHRIRNALDTQPEARGVEGMVLVPRDKLLELADILYDNRTTTASGLPVTVLECIDVAQAAAQEIRRYIAAAPSGVRVDDAFVRKILAAPLGETTIGNMVCAEVAADRLIPALRDALTAALSANEVSRG